MSDAIPIDSELENDGPEDVNPLDKELDILKTIHTAGEENKPVVQRDIAHIVGVNTSGPDGGSPDGNTAFYLRAIVE